MNRSGQHTTVPDDQTIVDETEESERDHRNSTNRPKATRRGYLALVTAGVASPMLAGQSAAETGQGYGVGGYGGGGYGQDTVEESPDSGDGSGDDQQDGSEESTPPTVTTVLADDVSATSATVSGFFWEGDGSESVSVYFEYRSAEANDWSTTATETRTEYGAFERTLTDLTPSTTYEYRAVAADSDDTVRGDTKSFETLSGGTSTPTIEELSVGDSSPSGSHANLVVDWSVADPDDDLQTLIVLVSDYQNTIRWELVSISGSSASGSEEFRIGYDEASTYEVTLSVTDAAGNQSLQRTQLP